jgi:hypothetical protein
MSNVVQLIPRNKEDKVDNVKEFLNAIAPDTDQIIFLRVNKEGVLSIGHTPLAVKDLILMMHQLNRYIQVVLESEDDMFMPDEDEE